jgi:hypothetical protein
MCQIVLILPLFGDVPTLPLIGIKMTEAKQNLQIFTYQILQFSIISSKCKCDPIGLKLDTTSSYGHVCSQLQVEFTYVNVC